MGLSLRWARVAVGIMLVYPINFGVIVAGAMEEWVMLSDVFSFSWG